MDSSLKECDGKNKRLISQPGKTSGLARRSGIVLEGLDKKWTLDTRLRLFTQ